MNRAGSIFGGLRAAALWLLAALSACAVAQPVATAHVRAELVAERAALLNKNEQARSRVEAMITRLKSLEHNA